MGPRARDSDSRGSRERLFRSIRQPQPVSLWAWQAGRWGECAVERVACQDTRVQRGSSGQCLGGWSRAVEVVGAGTGGRRPLPQSQHVPASPVPAPLVSLRPTLVSPVGPGGVALPLTGLTVVTGRAPPLRGAGPGHGTGNVGGRKVGKSIEDRLTCEGFGSLDSKGYVHRGRLGARTLQWVYPTLCTGLRTRFRVRAYPGLTKRDARPSTLPFIIYYYTQAFCIQRKYILGFYRIRKSGGNILRRSGVGRMRHRKPRDRWWTCSFEWNRDTWEPRACDSDIAL
mmetsp:Transcript_135486/g.235057  ORF Transcript_135486/g.235057 Transcript_135486/m.235057 type:complete len:284 (+) Transcript_135486:153-1004(+)